MSFLDKPIERPFAIAALCCVLGCLYACGGSGSALTTGGTSTGTTSGGTGVGNPVAATEQVRISNFSAASTLTANVDGSTTPALSTGQTSCTTTINGPVGGSSESLTFRDGSGKTIGSGTASVAFDKGTLSMLVYGPANALQVLPVNSDTVAGAYVITTADLSASATNYQVFVKNVDTGVSTQTSPITTSSRQVGLPVTATGNYEVIVQGGEFTYTSPTFTIDANHPRPIVAFYDNSLGTLDVVVVNGADACIG